MVWSERSLADCGWKLNTGGSVVQGLVVVTVCVRSLDVVYRRRLMPGKQRESRNK